MAEKEKKTEKIESAGGFNDLLENKKQLVAFILFALSAFLMLVYLFKMSLSGIALVYTILFCASGVLLAYYSYFVKKKNSTILFIAIAGLAISYLLRLIQSGSSTSIENIIRYLAFFAGTIFVFYKIFKEETKNYKTLIAILFLIGAADAIYLFFDLGNIKFLGYIWRLFLIAEAATAVGMILCDFELESLKELNPTCKTISEKMPKSIIIIIVAAVLAAALYVINLDSTGTTYDPITNSNDNGGGTIIDSKDEEDSDYTEEEEEEKVETVVISKDKTTTVKTTYSDEEYEAEISLAEMFTTDKVVPPKPQQSYYSYYQAKEGKTYLVVALNVKNVGSKTINSDYLFTNFLGDHCNPKAVFSGKYEYSSSTVVGVEKDNKGKYDLDSYYYIDALESVKLYTIYEISDEVSQSPATVNVCFGDVNLNIN